VRPLTVQPSVDVVHVNPPGDDVALYEVTGEPFPFAADQTSATLPLPATALVSPGALGTPTGVADSAFEAEPVPAAFVAVTVKVYVVPFVRPLTVQPSVEVEQVKPPGDEVAVYDVTGEPFGAAADQPSVTLPLPATALVRPGAPGGPKGVADIEFDAGPAPTALVAATVNVYAVPFVSPPTEQLRLEVVQVNPPGDEVTV
jgi:hypothetical protein